jgi:N-acetylneuraminic acid mutarotase
MAEASTRSRAFGLCALHALGALLLALTSSCARATDTPAAQAPSAPQAVWRDEASLQHPRSAHAVVSTGACVLAVAGSGADRVGGTVRPVLEVERLEAGAWSVETRLPGNGLNAPAAVWFEGKLWVIGGFDALSNTPVAEVRTYDLAQRSWAQAAPLPSPRGGHTALVHRGRIHVLGGGNSRSTLDEHSVFDPGNDSWSQLAPLTRSKGSPAALVFQDEIWLIGGRSGNQDFGDVERYDAQRDAWIAELGIEARGTASAVLFDGEIHVFGGESQARGTCLAEVLRLDLGQRAWIQAPAMPAARSYARAVAWQQGVLVVGGSLSPEPSHAGAGCGSVASFCARP